MFQREVHVQGGTHPPAAGRYNYLPPIPPFSAQRQLVVIFHAFVFFPVWHPVRAADISAARACVGVEQALGLAYPALLQSS